MNAENERIKLKATFYNNLAVAAVVAGLLVPFIALYPRLLRNEGMTPEGLFAVLTPDIVVSMGVAGGIAYLLRSRANAAIRSLEDED